MTANPSPVAAIRRALIVEDRIEFQHLLGRALALVGAGWKLDCHVTATAALKAIARPMADLGLVLVDLGLPDASGLDVIRAARHRFPAVPIMVASVFDDEASVISAIRAGANGYLLKGEEPPAMAHSIRQVLEGLYPISPAVARHLVRLAGGSPLGGAPTIQLTNRERDLIRLLAQGVTYEEAATAMGVTLSTVRHHVCNLYEKLEVGSKTAAVVRARETGWL